MSIKSKGPRQSDQRPIFSATARLWHNAFIGKTGSGKTYAARGEIEQIIDEGNKVIVIDPTGAWFGLRMNPDGTPSGRNIAIFGGAHGDRVLTPDMAPTLGRIAGRESQSMILDLSGTSLEVEDQREICYQFLKGLYQTSRTPVHLVIDEADELAPQELDKDTKPLRTMVARIMARGRSLGFRCTLITQRPAKIDKNSLSQVESMVCLRVTAPQDRKAIEEWFDDKGGTQRKDAIGGLGSLATGEGWVFVANEGLYEHRRFRTIKSYDSSQTPVDAQGRPMELDTGPIDLSAIDEKIAYPDVDSDAELEIAVARRRNLENDNKRLRARLLSAEARYEAMRQFFVGIRQGIDQILAVDDLQAIKIADLIAQRDEVKADATEREEETAQKQQSAEPKVELHDAGAQLTNELKAPHIDDMTIIPTITRAKPDDIADAPSTSWAKAATRVSNAHIVPPERWATMTAITPSQESMLQAIRGGSGKTMTQLERIATSPGRATQIVRNLIEKNMIERTTRGLYRATSRSYLAGLHPRANRLLALAELNLLDGHIVDNESKDGKAFKELAQRKLITARLQLSALGREAINKMRN